MNHIEQTIEDIDVQIVELTELRNALHHFNSGARPSLVITPAAQPATFNTLEAHRRAAKPAAVKAVKRARKAPAAPVTRQRALSPVGQQLLGITRALAQPFTVAAIAASAGAKSKDVTNFVQRCIGKGWLRTVSRGQYERTATFANQDLGGRSSGERMLADIHREIDATKPTE